MYPLIPRAYLRPHDLGRNRLRLPLEPIGVGAPERLQLTRFAQLFVRILPNGFQETVVRLATIVPDDH